MVKDFYDWVGDKYVVVKTGSIVGFIEKSGLGFYFVPCCSQKQLWQQIKNNVYISDESVRAAVDGIVQEEYQRYQAEAERKEAYHKAMAQWKLLPWYQRLFRVAPKY